jgi:hypothetical protein
MRRVWPLISQAALASQASGDLGIAGVRRHRGPPAPRRCSPRQAELSASQQGRPGSFDVRISSEASQPAWTGGCAAGPRTWIRHACEYVPRLNRMAPGRPPRMAGRWPGGTGLASYLSSCLTLTSQRCLGASPTLRRQNALPWRQVSREVRSVCPAFRRLSLGAHWNGVCARVGLPVLARSSSLAPIG